MICQTCQRALAHTKGPAPARMLQAAAAASAASSSRTLATRTFASSAISQSKTKSTLSRLSATTRTATPASASSLASTRFYSSSSSPESSTPSAAAAPLEKPDFLDEAESWIWDRLSAEFAPVEMAVRDVSGGCGSMYAIEITSDKFRGANMLKQQRMVNKVLGDKVKEWHGLQLRTKST